MAIRRNDTRGSTKVPTRASAPVKAQAPAPAANPAHASGVIAPAGPTSSGGYAPVSAVAERRSTAGGHSHASGQKGKTRAQGGGKGMGLRAKFMLVLAGVTAAALIALGVSMAATTNSFLFGQKQHSGIEIARMVAQVGNAVYAKLDAFRKLKANKNFDGVEVPVPTQQEIAKEMERYLRNAQDWYNNENLTYTDILGIRFDCPSVPELSQVGVGTLETEVVDLKPFHTIYLPKTGGSVNLPSTVNLYQGTKRSSSGDIPIYRFKIFLDKNIWGSASNGTDAANVRVDIAADSVVRVRNNLFITIGIAVFIAIGVVIAVANWLAGNITRPLDILISDMKTVARGRLDHETKARSGDEIGVLANEFNRMTQNLKIAQSALVEQEKAEYELSIAREVQRQLLPAEAPTIMGYDSAAFYQGAKAVSGDYFDFIPLGNGLWGFIIADVSGKGIPGSMVMAVTRTIVRLVANKFQNRAADTLKETNKLIAKQIKRGMFVTAFYAILDENTGTLTYASAGHNPMVIYRAATKAYELGTGKGIALGFNEGPVFDKTIQETRTTLAPGDMMVLYTDGFPEAMNAENQEFGEERFYSLIGQYGQTDVRTCLAKLVEAVAGHRGDAEQSDDLTIIAVRNVAGA
jgi:serine phosphatase RsbU (regulator of sigma subunit)